MKRSLNAWLATTLVAFVGLAAVMLARSSAPPPGSAGRSGGGSDGGPRGAATVTDNKGPKAAKAGARLPTDQAAATPQQVADRGSQPGLGEAVGFASRIVIVLDRPPGQVSLVERLQDANLRRSDVLVRLSGVKVGGSQVTGFRAFVNLPGADQATPPSHPRYVTSVAFFPAPPAAVADHPVGSFTVSLKRALPILLAGFDAPTLTLVPTGRTDAMISIGGSSLETK